MEKFKIGDKVVALSGNKNSLGQPRIKGAIYEVLDIIYCSKCGNQAINVSGKETNGNEYTQCGCGARKLNEGLWWTDSILFAPAHFRSDSIKYKLKVSIPELITIKEEQLT